MMRANIFTDTGVKYSRDWMQQKLVYQELTADKLSKVDKDLIQAQVKVLVNGSKTKEWVQQLAHEATLQGRLSNWSYKQVDLATGRCSILYWKGVEVALFFRRQTTDMTVAYGSPLPEHPIQDPDDVWQRLDLLGASAKRQNAVAKRLQDHLETENRELKLLTKQLKDQLILTEAKLLAFERRERLKQEAKQEKKELEEAKTKKPFAPRLPAEKDRLCTICGCYENVHNFDKKGVCRGCTGGKPKCKSCVFHPKRTRKKRVILRVTVKKKQKRG